MDFGQPQRVLLINPPIHDIRLPWAKFLQPTLLLRLASSFENEGTSVKMLDAVFVADGQHLHKEAIGKIDLDGRAIGRWHFGASRKEMTSRMRNFVKSNWYPDLIVVECLTSFWWQGAAEVIADARTIFPESKIALVGTYASVAKEHATENTQADYVIDEIPHKCLSPIPNLSVYEQLPSVVYLSAHSLNFEPKNITSTIDFLTTKYQIHNFAFSDHALISTQPDVYREMLGQLIEQDRRLKFYALGTISSFELAHNPELSRLMKQAGYTYLVLSDDRDLPVDDSVGQEWIASMEVAGKLLQDAGFDLRTGQVSASVSIGRLGENLGERAQTATLLSHHIGSVLFWPYQPALAECKGTLLQNINGKVFPLRADNGLTYQDYLELLGLGTVLNSKYRGRTFDFLGDGLIASLFRDSVSRLSWEPDPSVKGTIKLPYIIKERK